MRDDPAYVARAVRAQQLTELVMPLMWAGGCASALCAQAWPMAIFCGTVAVALQCAWHWR